ncbi:ThiF family adenylyltransferase [Niabella beijingensis]|uniref:ThiF family adenylyltransferase n=1 Tax=Niabella beijingensis TaxID=2872700 RepID=UPI001CBCB8C1|nr:ThiF family adenylyltransferase [Niabella beijingensis]
MAEINPGEGFASGSDTYRPVFLRIGQKADKDLFDELVSTKNCTIFDTIDRQLMELIRIMNPSEKLDQHQVRLLTGKHLGNRAPDTYGVWVYYPWSGRMVHLLDEDEFIKVRTNRNVYKITPEETALFRGKKIGIIGLSVGQTIAMTIATERICGALHLADYDDIELSNMNRLPVGVHELGMSKAILSARKIAELDPFISVTCFTEGVHAENMDAFFTKNGPLDLLVEECDGFDIKILSRMKARELGIPVVMDTNDKGMLDIERFDLERERPLFHGGIPDLEKLDQQTLAAQLTQLTPADKIRYLGAIVGMDNLSDSMKRSLTEIGKTITGWPQLASAVTLGGAIVTEACRNIFLNRFNASGKYFIDLEKIIVNPNGTNPA